MRFVDKSGRPDTVVVMKTSVLPSPVFAGLVAMLAGCTPTLDIATDGYAAPGTHPPGNYVIAPANPRTEPGDLRFKTFAAELERVMATKGWTRVGEQKDAATLVRFGYAVTGPLNDIRTYEFPDAFGGKPVNTFEVVVP